MKQSYEEYRFSMTEILKYLVQGLLLCGAVDYLFYQNPWLMFLALPVTVFFLKWKKKGLIRERKKNLNYQFKDALNALSVAVQAGYSVENAVMACSRDLERLYPQETDIVREFHYMETQLKVSVPVEELFMSFGDRSGIEDIENFAAVFYTAKRTGGDMNRMTIMYSKEDILFKALRVQTSRERNYCQKVRPAVLEKIRKMPNSTITMEKFKRAWYEGSDGSDEHYNWSRYYALNLHAVFSKGTLEWRCFESTLHAGEVRANITLALAISAQAINQKCTQMRKTEISENPAFTFRTFLLRLGLIGPEYKNVREHLLKNLEGDRAWRYDKSQYACLQQRNREQETR